MGCSVYQYKKRNEIFSVWYFGIHGCGLPYALATQIAHPERQCIAFVGDGGFAMLMAEFATAVQYNLSIKVIILKNNTLGNDPLGTNGVFGKS
jgi:thiamine pyrophosphate-dependent acetolactate synthase large subunit-like protein